MKPPQTSPPAQASRTPHCAPAAAAAAAAAAPTALAAREDPLKSLDRSDL